MRNFKIADLDPLSQDRTRPCSHLTAAEHEHYLSLYGVVKSPSVKQLDILLPLKVKPGLQGRSFILSVPLKLDSCLFAFISDSSRLRSSNCFPSFPVLIPLCLSGLLLYTYFFTSVNQPYDFSSAMLFCVLFQETAGCFHVIEGKDNR